MVSVSVQQQLIQGVSDIRNDRILATIVGPFLSGLIVLTTCKSSENSSSLLVEKEIDADQEIIRLRSTEPTEVKDLPKRIPKDSAGYHFFLYKHSHEGDYLQSTGDWIVTCPNTVNRRIFRYSLCLCDSHFL